MDKQEATEYVINRIDLGYTQTDIVNGLCKNLGAPPEMVEKFVSQIVSSFSPPPETGKPKPVQGDIPSWILEMEASGPPIAPDFEEEASIPTQQSTIQHLPTLKAIPQLEHPTHFSPAEENLIIKPQKEIDTEELSKFVVQELTRQRRQSDIVGIICQRTGWHWDEAQRYVARSRTTHHGEISKSQNRFMIPVSIVFIIGGVLLLIWSIYALADYYLGFTAVDRTTTLAADLIPLVLGALVTSFGIIAGGIFGLHRMHSAQ